METHQSHSRNMALFLQIGVIFAISTMVFAGKLIYDLNKGFSVAEGIAFGAAFSTLFLISFLILPRLRSLNQIIAPKVKGWDRTLNQVHSWVAIKMQVLSVLHGAAQIYRNIIHEERSYSAQIQEGHEDDHTGTNTYKKKLLSGIVLLVSALVTSLLAYNRHKISYRKFLYPHGVIAVFIVATYAVHNPHLWTTPFIIIPGLAYATDRIYERIRRTYNTQLADSSPSLSDKLVEFHLKKPAQFHYSAGQSVEINIPELGFEWHPFSIANTQSNQETLRFVISKQGKWTTGLYDKIHSLQSKEPPTKIRIRGPYYSSLQDSMGETHWVFFATGVGVNPFLAMMKLHAAKITGYIASRTEAVFRFTLQAINQKRPMPAELHFYYTGNKDEQTKRQEITSLIDNHHHIKLVQENVSSKALQDNTNDDHSCTVFLHTSRPKLNEIAQSIPTQRLYYAGNTMVAQQLKPPCHENKVTLITEQRLT